MKKITLLLLFFLISDNLWAQTVLQLKTKIQTTRPDTNRVKLLFELSDLYFKKNVEDSALLIANEGILLGQKLKSYKQIGFLYRTKGMAFGRNGDYENALLALQNSLKIFDQLHYPQGSALVYSELCYLYKRMGDAKKSAEFTKKGIALGLEGLSISESIHDGSVTSGICNNLGIAYRDLKDYDNARKYYLKAVATEKDTLKIGTPLSNLAQLYIEVDKDYDKAIQIYQRAEKVNLATKNYTLLEHTYRNIGKAYSFKGNPDKAIEYGEKSVALAKIIKDPHRQYNAHIALSESYKRRGDWANALKNTTIYHAIKDSLDEVSKSADIVKMQANFENQKAEAIAVIEAEKQRKISEIKAQAEIEKTKQIKQIEAKTVVEKARLVTEIRTKYETEKKEQKINELNIENTLRTTQLRWLLGGTILLVIFASTLIWFYGIIKTRNKDLADKNEKINQQSNQLEVLMRELHHRVKNNLGIVSGLLFLQIKFLNDEKAIKAVREGQQRIDAMGLIHQKLYQTENIEKVNIQEFIADLVDNLIRIYGFNKTNLDLDFDIDDKDFNVDLAIPLGLIINELLTNSFKYAYLDIENPQLRIHLKTDKNIVLEVADNGKGLDVKQWNEKKGSYGRQLIMTLSNQIGGELLVENHNGTRFKLTIPVENNK